MRRLAFLAALAAVLVTASAALAGGTIAGSYTAKIASPAQLKGTWVLAFAKGGSYAISDSGQVVVRGKYTASGSSLTFGHESGPLACTVTGKYTWARTGKTLKLKRVKDTCPGRSLILAHAFTQT
jgi:hypothetical protein